MFFYLIGWKRRVFLCYFMAALTVENCICFFLLRPFLTLTHEIAFMPLYTCKITQSLVAFIFRANTPLCTRSLRGRTTSDGGLRPKLTQHNHSNLPNGRQDFLSASSERHPVLHLQRLTSSSSFPSTRSSHDAMLPSESSASGLAGLKVLDM